MSSTEGKAINCRAAVFWKEGSPLTIENITVDPPKYNEVRVKVVAAGLCKTDLDFLDGKMTALKIDLETHPVVLGHEGAGVVESVGPEVTSVKPGDKVIAMWMPQCDECQLCANPKTNLCLSGNIFTNLYHKNKETRLNINGKALLLQTGTGLFTEYTVIRENQIAKVNPKADLKTVCIIGCSVGTGYSSAFDLAKVHPGAKCAVWGLGGIGLPTVLGCKDSGALEITGVDTNPDKENFAKEFGATKFINPKNLDESIESYFQKDGGLDYAFECTGNEVVLKSAYNSLSPWGSLICVGVAPEGTKLDVKVIDLINGRQILGGLCGKQKQRNLFQRLVDRHISGSLPIDGLITDRIPLDAINEGFDRLKAGKTVRTIIEF